jgi:hypothetical protein
MTYRKRCAATLLACVAMGAFAQTPPAPVGELKPLGNDRYQVGRIVVDKAAGRFTVPGRVHLLDKPLEYLASSPGGMKEYETLLQVDASGSEFNLACILLGLERDPEQPMTYQFSPQPVAGPRVNISIAWQEGGRRRQVSAAEALLEQGADTKPEAVEWVYTGSVAPTSYSPFAADVTGTLVGFVHDPSTIIDTVRGLGIGAYGSVNGNSALLPPVGSTIELVVEVPRASSASARP